MKLQKWNTDYNKCGKEQMALKYGNGLNALISIVANENNKY